MRKTYVIKYYNFKKDKYRICLSEESYVVITNNW